MGRDWTKDLEDLAQLSQQESHWTEEQKTLLVIAQELGKVKRRVLALEENQAQTLEEAAWIRSYASDQASYADLADL